MQDSFHDDVVTQLLESHDQYQIGSASGMPAVGSIGSSQPLIRFSFAPNENLRFDELLQISTENQILRKVLLVFAHLCEEMSFLSTFAKQHFFPALSLFGVTVQDQDELDGEKQLQFGRAIPLLMDLWNFCARSNYVVKSTIQQLASLFCDTNVNDKNLATYLGGPGGSQSQYSHFERVYETLGELLGVLITLDEIILQNSAFSHQLTLYKRMISKVMTEPERYGTTKQNVGKVYYLLEKVEGDVLDDSIFKSCINQAFEDVVTYTQLNKILKMEFEHHLKLQFEEILKTRFDFVGFCGLYILYFNLWMDNQTLKKLFKQVWEFHKKCPIIHLYGNTAWSSAEFFLAKVPDMVRLSGVKNPKKEIEVDRSKYMDGLIKSLFPNMVNQLNLKMNIWQSRFESNFDVLASAGRDVLAVEGSLLLQGLELAQQINTLVKNGIYLHILAAKSLSMSQVLQLCSMVEMVKSIQNSFYRKSPQLAKHISYITEFLTFKIQRFLVVLRNRLQTKKKQSNADADQLSAVLLALHLLDSGHPSKKRLVLLSLTLSVAFSRASGLFKESEYEEVKVLMKRLEVLAHFDVLLGEYCDCSYLYWNRNVIPAFFDKVYENPSRAPQLHLMMSALQDPLYNVLLSSKDGITPVAVHLEDGGKALVDDYVDEIMSYFNAHIVDPLCQEIETDLRLHIHNTNVFKKKAIASQTKDLSPFFKTLGPIRFHNKLIEIKRLVEKYLDKTFYDFTIIALHDWKTYEEMRNLAFEKYGLNLINVYLPGQTLEQGLDVLEITRNIHVFVSKFSYNLNQNMFIEQCAKSEAKSLNVLHIKHIANSIRTHGTGIMNTTINFVYRFLGKKLYIFSQFLFDDHIKSRLLKDIRFYKDEALKSLDNKFPLKSAKKFIKDIKKLGLSSQSGLSYLDQFRVLITEIGNALGYVRMVRAGGLRYINDAIQFVPMNYDANNMSVLCKDVFSQETIEAANNLHNVVLNMAKISQSQRSDYFKTLETVFKNELLKEQNNHLRNFYIIIPALTLSFVETMLISKDKMLRSGKEASFTDDGFALGVAFILKVLCQNEKFDSLHWFESVAMTFKQEYEDTKRVMAELSQKKNEGNKKKMSEKEREKMIQNDDELQTMNLTLNRILSYKREFELLFFSFSGARVFFRD
ncbi:hypothetical protein NAEGRDRAFT_36287 [Naegleria gruberi]|uniref:WASH complex subunit 7 n=1 Tax=Naegleria gruberi TaxID=5762 RepID=D2VBH6_NAEGR|nr:uncharacterized protein NAEGRDRAFT_36287 [Naegleria gruberi]EFC45800.1 hypothetical protein NAEGRDRAFT_36287 [Naegleria gruberi]|eukprot:XP_002678544.1 hypothetical protein NAEGRDRAFT_36287 [Naegleria gruberi strain NEG-M]